MARLRALWSVGLSLLWVASLAHAANETRYVSCVDGNDANTGLSSGAPKATIQSAINAQSGAGNTINVDGNCTYRGNSTMIASNASGTSGAYNVIKWWNRSGAQARKPFVTNLQPVTGFTSIATNVWCAPWHDSGVPRNSYAMVFKDRWLQGTVVHGQSCTLEYDGTCQHGTGYHPNRARDYWINGTAAPSSTAQLNADGEYFSDTANDRLCVYSTSDPDTRYTQPGVEAIIDQDNGSGHPLITIDHSYWRLDGITYGGCNWHCLIVGSVITSGTIDGWQFINGEGSFSRHRFTDDGPEGGTLHQLFSNDSPSINITNALIQNSTFHDSGRGTFNNTGNGTVTATYDGLRLYNNFNHGVTSLNHNGNGPRTLTFRNMHVSGICTPFFSADLGSETVGRTSNGSVTMSHIAITDPTFEGDVRRPVGANCAAAGNLGAIIDAERYTLTADHILISGFDRGFDQGNTFNITSCTHCTIVNNNQHGIRFEDGVDFTLNTSIVGGNGGNTVSATSAQVICADADCSAATWPGGDTATTENVYFRDDGSTTGDLFRADGANLTFTEWKALSWIAGDDSSVVTGSNPLPNAALGDWTPGEGSVAVACGTDTPNVGGASECGAIEVPTLGTCTMAGAVITCSVNTLADIALATVNTITPRVNGAVRGASAYAVNGTNFSLTVAGTPPTQSDTVTISTVYGSVQAQTRMSRYITARMYAVSNHPVTVLPVIACNLYASPSGSGTTCSQGSPCLVNSAWALLDPGETLCLLDGTYTGANSMIVPPQGKSGTAGNPITVRALNDGAVLIDGQNVRNPVRLLDTKYLTIEGINARNGGPSPASNGHCISVEGASADGDSSNNVIRRVVAWDCGTDNSKMFQAILTQDALFEDVAGFGIARKGWEAFESQRVTLRRGWFRWDGSPVTSQNPRMAVSAYYDSYDDIIENTITTWADLEGQSTDPSGTLRGALSADDHDGSDLWGQGRGNSVGLRTYGNIAYIDGNYTNTRLTNQQACRFAAEDNQEHRDLVCYVQAGVGSGIRALNAIAPESTSTNMKLTNATLIASTASSINAAWLQTNVENVTTLGAASSIFAGTTGATVCNRYVNGTLTSTPLWPWPMNQRILDATTTYSTVPVDVTGRITSIFGAIPAACTQQTVPENIVYVNNVTGSDSRSCLEARNPATPVASIPVGNACLASGDILDIADDQVHRVTAQITTTANNITWRRSNTGTKPPELTHASLITGWTASGTPNVWQAALPNNPNRGFWMGRYDLNGPNNTISNPLAYSSNAWYGTTTTLAKAGTCTPALLTANYEHCWRASDQRMLMYWTADPDTMTQPGVEAINLATRPESMLRCNHSGVTIDGIIFGPAAERHIQARQGCNNLALRNIEAWYSRQHDPEGWGQGQVGTVSIEQSPDAGGTQSSFLLEDAKIMFAGRDAYHAATNPTSGVGAVRDGITIQRVLFGGGYNHAAINLCHSGNGTTRNVTVDKVTIWGSCAPVVSWDGCTTATTNVDMYRSYLFDMAKVGDPRIPVIGTTHQCNSTNHWVLVDGQAGASTDEETFNRFVVTSGNHGFSLNNTGAHIRVNNSTIVNTDQTGVRSNVNGGSLETNRSIVAFNGTSGATSATNAQFSCAQATCTGLTWEGNDNIIRKDGGGPDVAFADNAARTLAGFQAIDVHDANSLNADPLVSLPLLAYAPEPGDWAPSAGSPAISKTLTVPYTGAGREAGAIELVEVQNCSTVTSSTIQCAFNALDTPIVANCALLTPSVNGQARTASGCAVSGDNTVIFNVSGAPMASGDVITMAFSLGGIQSGPAIGDPNTIFIRAPLLSTNGVPVTNTLSGGATGTFEQVAYRCRQAEEPGESFDEISTVASENAPCVIKPGGRVQVRMKLRCNGSTCTPSGFRPYVSINTGAYVPMVDSSTSQLARFGIDPTVDGLTPVTCDCLTPAGTFTSKGVFYKAGFASSFPVISLTAGQSTDYVVIVKVAETAALGDTIALRLYTDAGTALPTYTQTPQVLVGAVDARR